MRATPSRSRRWTGSTRRSTARRARRALVINGAGDKAFVSGGDLKELSAIRTEPDAAAMALRMRTICDRIAGFPTPILAALNGHALGGGAEFAVAADITARGRRRQNRLQPGDAGDHARLGRRRTARELVGYSQALLLAGTGTVLIASRGRTRRPDPAGVPAGVVRATTGARSRESSLPAPPVRSSASCAEQPRTEAVVGLCAAVGFR